ncbi:MAG: TIGR03619 family F420-dependent LLM class oxidoreductase [Acidimicrobiales bacterium]
MTEPRQPTLTLGLPTFGSMPGGDWRRLLEIAQMAEAAGVDRLVVTDHVVNGPNVADYPWGRFPTGPDGDWLEPLTVLSAIAGATERVRLSTGILIAPLRPAGLLAKSVATLDVLSGGRVDLGVGTGWQPEEFTALGVRYTARGRILTDTIAACRALWQDLPASFASETVSFSEIYCAPQPVQGRVPVWFSGSLNQRNLRRIVELGDGWIPIMGSTPEDIRRGTNELRAAFISAGRSPADLEVQGSVPPVRDADGRPDAMATMAAATELLHAGVTSLSVHIKGFDPGLDDAAGTCQALVEGFHAAL